MGIFMKAAVGIGNVDLPQQGNGFRVCLFAIQPMMV